MGAGKEGQDENEREREREKPKTWFGKNKTRKGKESNVSIL